MEFDAVPKSNKVRWKELHTCLQLGPLSKELPLKIKIPNGLKIGISIVPFFFFFFSRNERKIHCKEKSTTNQAPNNKGTINHPRQDGRTEIVPSSMAPISSAQGMG
jgi:hypothetical protein